MNNKKIKKRIYRYAIYGLVITIMILSSMIGYISTVQGDRLEDNQTKLIIDFEDHNKEKWNTTGLKIYNQSDITWRDYNFGKSYGSPATSTNYSTYSFNTPQRPSSFSFLTTAGTHYRLGTVNLSDTFEWNIGNGEDTHYFNGTQVATTNSHNNYITRHECTDITYDLENNTGTVGTVKMFKKFGSDPWENIGEINDMNFSYTGSGFNDIEITNSGGVEWTIDNITLDGYTLPLDVNQTQPDLGQEDVPVSSNISIQYNKELDTDITPNISASPELPGTWDHEYTTNELNNDTLIINNTDDFSYGTNYTIYINEVKDLDGQISNYTIDFTTEPIIRPGVDITSPVSDILTKENITVNWTGTSGTFDIDHYNISLDGSNYTDLGLNTSYNYSNLSEGDHTIEVVVYDIEGYNSSDIYQFTIELDDDTTTIDDTEETTDRPTATILGGLGLFVIILLVVVIYAQDDRGGGW